MRKEVVGSEILPSQFWTSPTGELANHIRPYVALGHSFKPGGVVVLHSEEEEQALADLIKKLDLHIEKGDDRKHYAVAVDIQDQKQYEKALQVLEKRFKSEKARKEDYKLDEKLREHQQQQN